MPLLSPRWPSALAQAGVLPALMVADYYLTLWGRLVLRREYLKRFQVEEYELNPAWRVDVGGLRWFNPRHLGLALLLWIVVGFFVDLLQDDPRGPWAIRLLLGGLVTPFALVVGRHLSNLATGWWLIRRPDGVGGAVQIGLPFLLATSRHQVAGALLPLAAAALWVRDPFLWGALAGGLALVGAHFRWARKVPVRSPGGPPPEA